MVWGIIHYLGKSIESAVSLEHCAKECHLFLGPKTRWRKKPFMKVKAFDGDTSTCILQYQPPDKCSCLQPWIRKTPRTSSSFLFLQEEGELKPVACGLRTLTEPKLCSAKRKKECLVIIWARERFSKNLTGLESFKCYKPLINLW